MIRDESDGDGEIDAGGGGEGGRILRAICEWDGLQPYS